MRHQPAWRRAVAAALLAAAAPSWAAPVATGASSYPIAPARIAGLADFVDGVMAEQLATREVAGAVVAVVYRGKVLFAHGYGFADLGKGIAVDPQQTLFRPGSTSKMFTWTSLMQQVEAGRVDLNADVNTYIDFKIPPYQGQPLRVRDLLSHSEGFSDVEDITAPSVDKLTYYADWIKTHIPQRVWAPGVETAYSNYGVALAGYIVERTSGERFPDYVERHIFRPLGMTSTTFREPLPATLAPRMALGYKYEKGKLNPKPFELFSNIMPAGSGTSSALDMTRFMMMMLNGGSLGGVRILKPESVRLLMSDTVANTPGLPGMAHGFFVVRKSGPRLVGHGGNTGDFHSNMILAPEAGLGFFVSETGGEGSYLGRTELTEALIGRLFPVASGPLVAAPAGETLPLGMYRTNRRDFSRAADPKHDLKVSAAGPDAITVTNEGRTTYWERVGPLLFEQRTGARAGGPYERLHFYRQDDDWRLGFSSQPHVLYRLVKS